MNPKPIMLAATEFCDGATGSGMVAGFRDLGWLVQTVDHGQFAGCGGSLMLRMATWQSRKVLQRLYREAVWRECSALRPDVFFTVKGSGLDVELLRRIRGLGTKTVMYYPDVHFDHAGVDQASFELYDLFVTTKSFQLDWLRQRLGSERVAYLPHGFSGAVFQPVIEKIKEENCRFDVLYMGNHSPYKQSWLQRLLELSPGLDLGVVGGRWREQRPALDIPESSFLGQQTGLSLSKLIQSSRINVAIHHARPGDDWVDLVSTRTFEIPACRGFMLHIDNAEVREFFDVPREIDVFSSADELQRKIQFYLSRTQLRLDMAERAYSRAISNYSYGHRAAQIDEILRSKGQISAILS